MLVAGDQIWLRRADLRRGSRRAAAGSRAGASAWIQQPPDRIRKTRGADGLYGPWGVSLDSDQTVWVANFGPLGPAARTFSVSQLCGALTARCPAGLALGDPISPASGYTLPSGGAEVHLHNGQPPAPAPSPLSSPIPDRLRLLYRGDRLLNLIVNDRGRLVAANCALCFTSAAGRTIPGRADRQAASRPPRPRGGRQSRAGRDARRAPAMGRLPRSRGPDERSPAAGRDGEAHHASRRSVACSPGSSLHRFAQAEIRAPGPLRSELRRRLHPLPGRGVQGWLAADACGA